MHPLFMEELPYDPNQVTPGWIGFAATALVAVVVMLLMWDFNRRVRRINDRADARERLEAEVAAQHAEQGAHATDGDGTTDGDGATGAAAPSTAAAEPPQEPRA